MIGLYVTVPVACFRPGAAREFWESLPLPPPSTVYGFLLSLVGETDRNRHLGVRCTAGIVGETHCSTVLRRMWRIKELGGSTYATPGNGANVRPDYQQLLTNVRLVVLVTSREETNSGEDLVARIESALNPKTRKSINRFGGLSLGESTHMVDEVQMLQNVPDVELGDSQFFLLDSNGGMSLPVWVDHVGSAKSRYATGTLTTINSLPAVDRIPQILSS
jgi:CRISPR-associated protein Cas5t